MPCCHWLVPPEPAAWGVRARQLARPPVRHVCQMSSARDGFAELRTAVLSADLRRGALLPAYTGAAGAGQAALHGCSSSNSAVIWSSCTTTACFTMRCWKPETGRHALLLPMRIAARPCRPSSDDDHGACLASHHARRQVCLPACSSCTQSVRASCWPTAVRPSRRDHVRVRMALKLPCP